MKMKAFYASGLVLMMSGLLAAGETETMKGATGDMIKGAAKDAAAEQMPGMEEMAPGMSEMMDDEEMFGAIGDVEMSADEMDEEGDLLIAEGKALKKRAAEIRLQEKAEKEKAGKKGK